MSDSSDSSGSSSVRAPASWPTFDSMRIGLPGGGSSVDRIVQQAVAAEADGFTSLWFASAVFGDPLVPMAIAGKATSTIELGTSVLQTYTCHPVLQANRAAAAAAAM